MLSFGETSREMFFIHQLGTNSVHTQSPCFPAWLYSLPSPELRFPQQRKKKKKQSAKRTGWQICDFWLRGKTSQALSQRACLVDEAFFFRGCWEIYQHQQAFLYGLRTPGKPRHPQCIIMCMHSCSDTLFSTNSAATCLRGKKGQSCGNLGYLGCTTMIFITVKFQPLGTLWDGL